MRRLILWHAAQNVMNIRGTMIMEIGGQGHQNESWKDDESAIVPIGVRRGFYPRSVLPR
jgi:hypothetical protein